jgi:hypothetical protein
MQFIIKTNSSMDAQISSFLKQMKTAENSKIISQEKASVDGHDGYCIKTFYKMKGTNDIYKQEQYIIELPAYFCWIGYTSPSDIYDKYHPAMQHFIGTIKFKDKQ